MNAVPTTLACAAAALALTLSLGAPSCALRAVPAPPSPQRGMLPLGSQCRVDQDCASGVCWDVTTYDRWCTGALCSDACQMDADCVEFAVRARAPWPAQARCGRDLRCDLARAGLGQIICE